MQGFLPVQTQRSIPLCCLALDMLCVCVCERREREREKGTFFILRKCATNLQKSITIIDYVRRLID